MQLQHHNLKYAAAFTIASGFAIVWQSARAATQGDSSILVPSITGATSAQPNLPPPVQPQARAPQLAVPQATVIDESVPAPQSQTGGLPQSYGVGVRTASNVKYDTDRGARRMYARSGSVNLIMAVRNPADGCVYEIPLCIPGCCTGARIVNSHCGLLGRGVVEYCWPCGFKAEVKFREIRGDVRVDYDG